MAESKQTIQKAGRANVSEPAKGADMSPAPITFPEPQTGPGEAASPPNFDPKLERDDKRKDKQPSDKDLEGTPLDPAYQPTTGSKKFSAYIRDNAVAVLNFDGKEYELTGDELHNLSNVLSTVGVELVR